MVEDVKSGNPAFEEEVPTAKHAWSVLFSIFLLCMFIAGAWMVIPAVKGGFMATFGASSMAAFGSLMQYVSYGAFVGAIIAAPLAQKASIKVAFIVSALFAIIGVLICALAVPAVPGDPEAQAAALNIFLIGRALLGVSVGLAAVNSTTALGVWFPVKTRGTAMAIWAVWVPVGMLIFQNAAQPIIDALGGNLGGYNNLFFIFAILLAIALVLIIVLYRAPREGEVAASARKKIPLRQALPYLAKPVLIAVTITWLVFNAVNQVVTTYIVTFFKSGYTYADGSFMDPTLAVLLGSVASAAGIAAIIFGFISDRLPVPKKYILIVISAASLTLAMVLGFKPQNLDSGLGIASFVGYLIFMFIGNAGLVACVRPYVPLLVGKGGAVAIGYALAGVTLIQYIGQMFSQPFGAIVDGFIANQGVQGATAAVTNATGAVDPALLTATGVAFGEASYILIGIAAVGFIASFFLRIKAPKPQATKQD